MTEITSTPEAIEANVALSQPPRPRGYVGQVVAGTLASRGAAFGAAFVGVVGFFAVFAPLLANTHPLVMKTADGLSFPAFRFYSPADAVLQLATLVGLALVFGFKRDTARARWLTWLWIAAALIPLASWKTTAGDWDGLVDTVGYAVAIPIAVVVGLTLSAVLVCVPLFARIPRRLIVFALAVVLPLAVFFTLQPVDPPLVVVGGLERYRAMEKADEIDWALYAPIPYSPSDRQRDHPERRLSPPWWALPNLDKMPDAERETLTRAQTQIYGDPTYNHWLGTERDGADILSRMMHACRIALAVGFIATGIALLLGVTIGALMGYRAGVTDLLGMRLIEVFEAVPQIYLLLTFVAFFPRNLYIMMAIIGLTSWTGYARFTRAEFLKLRKQDFVQAAIAGGLPLRSILFRHMLPNGVAPVLVTASFGIASAILTEAYLSFLGLGLVDEPSWGQMLDQAQGQSGAFAWWIAIFPGGAIFLTVFAYNLIGEALRDAIDPHSKKSAHL